MLNTHLIMNGSNLYKSNKKKAEIHKHTLKHQMHFGILWTNMSPQGMLGPNQNVE